MGDSARVREGSGALYFPLWRAVVSLLLDARERFVGKCAKMGKRERTRTGRSSWVSPFLALLIGGASACGPPPRGVPLYDASRGALPREQVAQLSGQIIAIDGHPITQDIQRFEVLPGCHMLRMTGTVWYSSATQPGGVRIYVGEQEFAVNAEAGHEYYIQLEHGGLETGTPTGRVEVRWVVTEYDLEGNEGWPVQLFARCN